MAQFNVTELDFDKIKENLIEYYKAYPNDKYKDYDFDGSGLNILMDILAYNTHYNAINAHTSINETFLDSAQLRQNVVSRAKLLGYTPNSIVAPSCDLTLTFDGSVNDSQASYTLEAGKKITAKIDNKTYTFITLDDYVASLVDNQYVFENVKFYQGVVKEVRYIVRDTSERNQKYLLRDATADISQLKVKLYDNENSSNFRVYSEFSTFSNITAESDIYFISENHDGFYEVEFGNGIYGTKPSNQNIIELEYLSTLGPATNGAAQFTWADSDAPSALVVTSRVSGGTEKEGIESIRFHAPLTFQAQERAVTVDDYQALIKRDFPAADAVSVWGGQDNTPPRYGTVFVSVKPHYDEDNNVLTYAQKTELKSMLSSKNVASTVVEVVDPDYTYLKFDIYFKYDTNQTDLARSVLESNVRDTIELYNTNNLDAFNTVFRYSNFLSSIDNSDRAIISSTARISVFKEKSLVENDKLPSVLDFDIQFYGDIDDSESMISSDIFKYNGSDAYFGDEPLTSTTRRVYIYKYDSQGNIVKLLNDAGTITPITGTINFNAVPVDEATTINVYCTPASNDIVARKNNLLQVDHKRSIITADIDAIRVAGAAGAINYTTYNK